MNDDKSLNQSIIKAFKLLDAFTNDKKEWGVRELANKIGYNKSTTYRLLNTLSSLNVVHQKSNEKYSLGSKLFELGNRVSFYQSIKKVTNDAIRNTALRIEETVLLSTLKDNQVFYLNKADSLHGLKINTSIGSYQPIHATASGKLLLAHAKDSFKNDFLKTTSYNKLTENTITSASKLNNELTKIKQQGFSLDLEEFELGLVCIALPIHNKNRKVIASISASGPLSRFKVENIKKYCEILQQGVHSIEEKLSTFEQL